MVICQKEKCKELKTNYRRLNNKYQKLLKTEKTHLATLEKTLI